WDKFKTRFRIPRVLEFYAATEGNLSLYNVEDKPGAIGRVPSFLAHRFPAAIVKFDTARGEPLRDANGLCIRCAPDEVGEAIGRCPGVLEATVYGVAIPGADGRAGMAALAVGDGFDLDALRRHLADALPDYAQPVFLRIGSALETTATFKHKKDELMRAGY